VTLLSQYSLPNILKDDVPFMVLDYEQTGLGSNNDFLIYFLQSIGFSSSSLVSFSSLAVAVDYFFRTPRPGTGMEYLGTNKSHSTLWCIVFSAT
jgi:hypothetical protein